MEAALGEISVDETGTVTNNSAGMAYAHAIISVISEPCYDLSGRKQEYGKDFSHPGMDGTEQRRTAPKRGCSP